MKLTNRQITVIANDVYAKLEPVLLKKEQDEKAKLQEEFTKKINASKLISKILESRSRCTDIFKEVDLTDDTVKALKQAIFGKQGTRYYISNTITTCAKFIEDLWEKYYDEFRKHKVDKYTMINSIESKILLSSVDSKDLLVLIEQISAQMLAECKA